MMEIKPPLRICKPGSGCQGRGVGEQLPGAAPAMGQGLRSGSHCFKASAVSPTSLSIWPPLWCALMAFCPRRTLRGSVRESQAAWEAWRPTVVFGLTSLSHSSWFGPL